jgi:hypothetical protein
VKDMDFATWVSDEEANLRRRLHALADADPVDDAWETIQRRIEAEESRARPARQRVAAAVAAVALVLAGCMFTLLGREDGSSVDTVEGTTSTSERSVPIPVPGDRTTTTATTEPTAGEQPPGTAAPPSGDGSTPDSTVPGRRPNAGIPSTTTEPTSSTTTTDTTTRQAPLWQVTFGPTVIRAADEWATMESVTPCVYPSGTYIVVFDLWYEGTQIWHYEGGAAQLNDGSGSWTKTFVAEPDTPPGEYVAEATCWGYDYDLRQYVLLGTYERQTYTVVAAG